MEDDLANFLDSEDFEWGELAATVEQDLLIPKQTAFTSGELSDFVLASCLSKCGF